MDCLDFDKYGVDAYVLLDVPSEKLEDAHVFESKQLKQQLLLIFKLLGIAFGHKEINCEKLLEINGKHYCVSQILQ